MNGLLWKGDFFRFLFLLAAIIGVRIGIAQSPYFRHITTKDGLPSATIYSIVQDDAGYLWLGTNVGLSRFDGLNFTNYDVPNSLGSAIDNLRKGSDGRIFFKNFGNQIFYTQDDSITSISLPDQEKRLKGFELRPDGSIVAFIGNSFFQSSTDYSTWELIVSSPTYSGSAKSFAIYQDQIWILDQFKIRVFGSEEPNEIHVNQRMHQLSRINGKFLILDISGRIVYQLRDGQIDPMLPSLSKQLNGRLISANGDQQGRLWITSTDGVICYSKDEIDAQGNTYLAGNFVSDFLQDNEGNYWFSTIGNGLYVMYDDKVLIHDAGNSMLKFDQIKRIESYNNDELILATNGAKSYRIDQQGKILTTYDTPRGDSECIFVDQKNGRVILESLAFDTETGGARLQFFGGNTPKSIQAFQKDYLAIAAGDGAYIITNPSATGKSLDDLAGFNMFERHNNDECIKLRNQRTRCVYVDSQDRIWFGFADGLRYHKDGVSNELRQENGEPIIALSMQPDLDGTFWITTMRQGIFNIDDTQVIKHLTTQDGLISNFGQAIELDEENIYYASNKGLQVIHKKSDQFRFFNQQDGLPTDEITDIAISADKIWVSTLQGLVSLDKSFNGRNHTPPMIHLHSFKVAGESKLPEQFHQLDYNQNNLTFGFTGISYRSEGKFQYAYRMLGIDTLWNYIPSTNQELNFFSMPPGAYTFEVKAINEDGVESSSATSVSFAIDKPYWQKWWFVLGSLLLVIILVSGVFIWRIRSITRRNNMEKALQAANLSALNLQMNPHFIFNALSSIQNYIIQSDTKNSISYLSKFGKLMRQILEHSREEYITIKEESDMLTNYLEIQQLRFRNAFDFNISIDSALNAYEVKIPPLFIQPFVENAIEHGLSGTKRGGELAICFDHLEEGVRVSVIDNGNGLRKTQKSSEGHQSLATKITRERLQLLQGATKNKYSVTVENNPDGQGVISTLIVPALY